MTTNVLNFPTKPVNATAPRPVSLTAQVVDIADYRERARRLRLATGVYFVSRLVSSADAPTAA